MLGILGGGQLARMLALAAAPLGVKTQVVDNVADACAGQVAPLIQADWSDQAALDAFAAQVDVVTSISRTCRPRLRAGWPARWRCIPIPMRWPWHRTG
ncbi:phosphoribosylaminoimidazole carboxylase ATPase subunit [Rhodanobacter sp. 115]|nr:phosphoribosylaminoimidazole carboxylase ATPase subunit [Rhodanobacter sp. 115]